VQQGVVARLCRQQLGQHVPAGHGQRPEIVSTDDEREILFGRLCASTARSLRLGLRPEITVGGGPGSIAEAAVTGLLRRLRVMSARQLAVLLGTEADRGRACVIEEPPRYTAQELAGE
jgi:hypothetical protein